jgi:hypothetical protein
MIFLQKNQTLCAALLLVFGLSACMEVSNELPVERSLNNTAHGYKTISSPTRKGEQSQRFEVRPGDCGRDFKWSDCDVGSERSEVAVKQQWHHGDDVWIGFSIYVPPNIPKANTWTTIGQIHQNDVKMTAPDGSTKSPNHMQFAMSGNDLELAVWSQTEQGAHAESYYLRSIKSMEGKWTDIQWRFDTKNSNGDLEIWMDDRLVKRLSDTVTVKPSSYYFKYGIYRAGLKRLAAPIPTQVVIYDEVRIGSTREAVNVRSLPAVD